MTTTKPTVLFVCVHNAGRSQLAAGLAAHRAGDVVEVLSAGVEPDEQVDAVALASLAELGIDRSDQVPTRLTEDLLLRADVVVTLKPDLDVPHTDGVSYENWPLPDPAGWDLDGIRPLRDHLDERIQQLLTELTSPPPSTFTPSGDLMTEVPTRAGLPGLTSDEAVLHRIVDKLAARFTGIFAAETVDRYVFESYTALARTSKIRAYLVPRTERFASDRLTALATAKGAIEHTVPEVLFICVQNSGRSQMAASLLKARGGDLVNVRSAGSAPAEQIDPHAVEVMAGRGISLAEEFPKPLTDDVIRAADVIVTMGCGDSCPIYTGKRYLDWKVTDPAGKSLEETETIATDLESRVNALLDELVGVRS